MRTGAVIPSTGWGSAALYDRRCAAGPSTPFPGVGGLELRMASLFDHRNSGLSEFVHD